MILLKVGDLLYLREEDYLYGTGKLTLRVTQVLDLTGPQWLHVRGISVGWDGSQGQERDAWINVAALKLPRIRQAPRA